MRLPLLIVVAVFGASIAACNVLDFNSHHTIQNVLPDGAVVPGNDGGCSGTDADLLPDGGGGGSGCGGPTEDGGLLPDGGYRGLDGGGDGDGGIYPDDGGDPLDGGGYSGADAGLPADAH